MEKVWWNEGLSVGIREIDEQHKKLFDMINKLIDVTDEETGSEKVSEVLTEMTKYARYHFDTEERYLIQYDYPGFDFHKKQHQKFKKKTVDFCVDAMLHKPDVIIKIISYLQDWLLNHILESDMRYVPFLAEKIKADLPTL